jgi:hypothetical protein
VAGVAGFWLLRPEPEPLADVEASESDRAPPAPPSVSVAPVVAASVPVVGAPAPSGSVKPVKRVQTKKPTTGGVPMWENY